MLELRPHQKEVVTKIEEGFADGHRCQLLYAPTGFGKTEVAMAIMKEVSAKYQKTAMVLDRIVLVNQTSTRLARYGINHGVMQADHWRFRPIERIQVCSAQTLEKRDTFPDIDLMIIDECHVQRKSVVDFVKQNPSLRVIGLTATPFTKGLGNVYTNVVGAKSTGELIDNGWLTPLKVFIAKEIDMEGATKNAFGDWKEEEVTQRGMQITGDIVVEWEKKTFDIFGGPKKTVVFCAGVDHGRDLEIQFRARGYNFVAISYKEDGEFKEETIEEFSKPDSSIHGLIATDILTRGFDVPDVMIGVSARPFSKSFSSHVQQMGRIMRPFEGKKFCVWLDHSGNYLRFRKEWDKLYDEGVTELNDSGETTKKEPDEKEKKEAKCPACKALWIWPSNVCGECGHEKPLKILNVVPGVLEELGGVNKKIISGNQDFYSELLHYAKERNYKEGWAAHKYKEKYGHFPNGLHKTTRPTSLTTANFIKSRYIAWSKSQAKP